MHILHYNIFNGMTGEDNHLSLFAEYLQDHPQIDLLMLNEYRSHPGLHSLLHDCGFHHQVVNDQAQNKNKAAVCSKTPLGPVLATPDSLRLVMIRMPDFNLVCYHASPDGVEAVQAEVQALLPMLDPERPLLLCGDLNSLSANDCAALNYDAMQGSDQLKRYQLDGQLDYGVLSAFEAAGFIDQRGPGRVDTVPTQIGRKSEQGARLRLDYCLSRNLPVQEVSVLDQAPFPHISDHYPLAIMV